MSQDSQTFHYQNDDGYTGIVTINVQETITDIQPDVNEFRSIAQIISPMNQSDDCDKCVFCLNKIEEDNIYTTICNHQFHKNCFDDYYATKFNGNIQCPLCRHNLYINNPFNTPNNDLHNTAVINTQMVIVDNNYSNTNVTNKKLSTKFLVFYIILLFLFFCNHVAQIIVGFININSNFECSNVMNPYKWYVLVGFFHIANIFFGLLVIYCHPFISIINVFIYIWCIVFFFIGIYIIVTCPNGFDVLNYYYFIVTLMSSVMEMILLPSLGYVIFKKL